VEFYLEDSGRVDIAFAIRKLVTSHGEEEALRALGVVELEKQAVVRHFGLRTANEQAPPPVNRHEVMQAEAMAKSRIALLERLGAIADGTEGSALAWLCDHVDGPVTKYGAASLTRIRRYLGDTVADAMVEGLQRFWRKNRPSAPEPGSNSTPYVAIIGLRGLELEADRGGFFNGLSAEDATAAAWFAMHEINGLPPWFDQLLAEHPQSVRPVLTEVIQHEWDTQAKCYGLLGSALRESQRIQAAVAEVSASLLLLGKPGNATALSDSFSVILAQRGAPSALGMRLPQLVEEFEREGAEDYIIACLRAWSHVAPADVSSWFERSGDRSSSTAERRVLLLAAALGEEVDEWGMRRGRPIMEIDAWQPAVVARWIRFVFRAVPTKTDRAQNRSHKRPEMYAVQPRDYAERFRDRLFYALGKNTTAEARLELRRLRQEPVLGNRLRAIPRMLQWQGQAIANTRMRLWTEPEVAEFENQDESQPRDTRDLLALVRRHLEGIAEEVERGDFRFTALFRRLGKGNHRVAERDVQLWLAQTLKLASRGLYEVTREPEVDARKKPDISATTGGCSRVPIEIKPADWYSLRELEECLQDQLIGQYMRPESVRHGVLVIASLGVKRTWKLSVESGDFRELCAVLQRRADTYAIRHTLEKIAVVGIRLAE
jgi:hypothetical protein